MRTRWPPIRLAVLAACFSALSGCTMFQAEIVSVSANLPVQIAEHLDKHSNFRGEFFVVRFATDLELHSATSPSLVSLRLEFDETIEGSPWLFFGAKPWSEPFRSSRERHYEYDAVFALEQVRTALHRSGQAGVACRVVLISKPFLQGWSNQMLIPRATLEQALAKQQ